MRASSVLAPAAALAASTLAFVVAIAACSSSSDRASFDDDAGTTPTPDPTNGMPPPTGQEGGPVDTSADSGLGADAPDTCKRAAPSNACGASPQCGCTLTQTCDVVDDKGTVACIPAGIAAMGSACVNTSGCARGLTCLFGTCHAFCDSPGSACTTANTDGCIQVESSASDAGVPNLVVCRVGCELRDHAGCGPSGAAGTGVCMEDGAGNTDCHKGGTTAAGLACGPTALCGPGLVCAGNTTTGNTCRKWCRVGTTDCGGAVACNSFSTKIFVGTVEYAGCP